MQTTKAMSVSPRTGRPTRREVWHAEYAGWSIDRLEAPGTPWALTHLASGHDVGTFGSRQAAQRAVDDGTADLMLHRTLVRFLVMWMAGRASCPPPGSSSGGRG